MKTKAKRRGFTLIELLVVVTIIAMLAGGAYLGYSALLPKFRSKQTAKQTGVIYTWLVSYANDRGGRFPEGDNANMAYRELFKAKVGADEKQFFIAGDAYHKNAPGGKNEPDGDTGGEPDFVQALETGENAMAYVSGLTSSDTARIPLIANGFSSNPGTWAKNKNEKGGVYQGEIGVVCRVGGSAAAVDIKDGSMTIKEKSNGQEVNIFTSGFGDTQFNVLNPL